ncbi:MAG: hypothetical protein FJZ86_09265 [Chloroflexi bacterium]|nr:hypothetical protein [Chloroflexota bacterium]
MYIRIFHLISSGLVLLSLLSACAPKATPIPVDLVGTRAADLASMMMTQTAAAYSPTPPPTFTPEPTATATIEPTSVVIRPPTIKNGPAACYVKPSTSSALTSNITDTKVVELLAIGATPGWYKILNPYFYSPCWVAENNLDLDNNMDLSTFPTE